MRRQKIYNVVSMLALLLLGACSLHEEDNFFDDSSANRISEALKSYKEILVAPENGWVMAYYPAGNQVYGGYNILVSFNEDGSVKVASELYQSDEYVTSLYTLKQSAGPVLTFDSYNEIMHLFSEPQGGLGGDYEFTIMSATSDKVVMSGTKTRNMIVLTPMPSEQTWDNYLENVVKVQDDIFLGSFRMIVNGKVVGTVMQDYNVFTLTYIESGDKSNIPFVYTPDGLKLYEPIVVDGVTISTFRADVPNVSFICKDDAVDAKLEAFYPEGYRFYDQLVGTYNMGTKTVRVAANPDGKTYTLTGFYSLSTVQAEYVRTMGTLSINVQSVGMALGYYAHLCVWNTSSGSLTWAEGYGMTGVNSVDDPLTISFVDNGAWGESDSFIVYAFTGLPPVNTNAVGTLERIVAPVMVKQN